MGKDKFMIDFPEDDEIQKSINKIVKEAITRKESFTDILAKMYREIGLRYLFRDISELVYILIINISIVTYLTISAMQFFRVSEANVFTFIFIVSPFLFLTSCFISFTKLKQDKTFEVEMTCKYNTFQIAGFRMFVFSIFSLLLNGILISLFIHTFENISYLEAFLISASSLLLYALLYLAILLKIKSRAGRYGLVVVWVISNLLLLYMSNDFYQLFLANIPIYFFIIFIVALGFIYIKSLSKLVKIKSPEGVF